MMMHGTVMKITEHKIVVLCEDGKFLNLPHPPVMPRLGDRIAVPPKSTAEDHPPKKWLKNKQWAIAASLLLIIGLALVVKSWQGMTGPIAYVAIDINPGIELYVNKQGHIKQALFINEDARDLMSEGDLLGMEFYEAMQLIWTKAEEHGYLDLNSNKKWIWVSVVDLGNSSFSINSEKMGAVDKGYEVELFMTSQQQLEQAHDSGLSLNKYIVYERAKEKGIDLNMEELRSQSIITSLQNAGVAPEQLFVSEQVDSGRTGSNNSGPKTQNSGDTSDQEKLSRGTDETAKKPEPELKPTPTPTPMTNPDPQPKQVMEQKPKPTNGSAEVQSPDTKKELEIVKLELEIERDRYDEFKLKYKNKNGKSEAKVETKSKKGKDLQEGEQAISLAELMIKQLALTEQLDQTAVHNQILSVLNINQDEWKKIELEIEFSSGTKLEFKYKNDSKDREKIKTKDQNKEKEDRDHVRSKKENKDDDGDDDDDEECLPHSVPAIHGRE